MNRLFRHLGGLLLVCLLVPTLFAQTFTVSPNTIPIVIAAGVNHLPLQVPVTYSPANQDWTKVTVSSDAAWATGRIDVATGNLEVTFAAGDLIKRSYTATLSLSNGTHTTQVFVQATVSAQSIVRVITDPMRPRAYAAQQDGVNQGAVLVYDTMSSTYLGSISVGNRPCDLAISRDGTELLAICNASKSISVVDLNTLAVKETIPLAVFNDWGVSETSAHVAFGPGNILYYSDGEWAPRINVFDRATRTTLQTLRLSTSNDYGWGGFALSPDQKNLYGWAQYGWSAGIMNSFATRHSIVADGKLTLVETAFQGDSKLSRDPLNVPVLVSADGKTVVIKQLALHPTVLSTLLQSTPTAVYAISPNAEILSTATAIYSLSTGNKLYDLPVSSTAQAISSDYGRLVYFDNKAGTLKSIDLTKVITLSDLGLRQTPSDKAIVQAPTELQWSPVFGVQKYRVYLGSTLESVTQATPSSAEYLGEVNLTSLTLPGSLTSGNTYYWRVDAVSSYGVTAGTVTQFTVSSISSDTSSITTSTVQVHRDHTVPITLSSTPAGMAWTASSDVPWISFAQNTGVTPATLQVKLNASLLTPGISQGKVSISTPEGSFTIPVKLQVDALALTLIRSDPRSTKLYAISESDPNSGTSRAYLLEIDALRQKVTRVVRVGSSATDLALHPGDNRVYVPNWKPGGLLAVSLATFQVERTYATKPFGGVGYGTGDVYRVSAGVEGRLVLEEQDQWIDISIMDTSTGTILSSVSEREGGGQCSPSGRYYYHGDNNISSASIHKYDMLGDKIAQVTETESVSLSYYGSRLVVMSEDGSRVFWNGVALDSNLKVLSKFDENIQAVSYDGKYAFSFTKVYDVDRREVVATLPQTLGSVLAYNTATGRLVGQSGGDLVFHSPFGTGVLGAGLSPKAGSVISSLTQLTWTTLPGVDAYRVYLGNSETAVQQATTSSAEYLGAANGGSMPVPSGLETGKTYYWRVDLVIGGSVIATQSQSFTLSKVVPAVLSLEAVGVQGYSVPASLPLTAPAGTAWTASSAASWIQVQNAQGTGSATVSLVLETSSLATGTNTSSVTLSGDWGSLTIPVKLTLDPLALTVMRADPESSKVYAINEADPLSGKSRAFLLEIDAASETVVRSVQVGASATDLAIHSGDQRIYVPNWQLGGVLGVNLNTFAIDRTLTTPPYGAYGEDDAYKVAGKVAGRLITEAEDQWIHINLYDTVTGAKLATTFQREGGGQLDPTGRYYYHGDNNSSGAALHKLDLLADGFKEVAKSVDGANSYGGRHVVVSEDGSRIFWAKGMFDANALSLGKFTEEIACASADGRYAVGKTQVWDTASMNVLYTIPGGGGAVSAISTRTKKLVVQNGKRIGFYLLDTSNVPPTPVLSQPVSVASTSVTVAWTTSGLQAGFTLQYRASGATAWDSYPTAISGNTTQVSVNNLVPGTTYEFRIKADSSLGSSGWSTVLTVTTLTSPPLISQQPTAQVTPSDGPVVFSVTVTNPAGVTYQWYKNGQAIPGATGSSYTIAEPTESDAGSYTVKITNSAGTVTSTPSVLSMGNLRIVNMSIRSYTGAGSEILVVGFVAKDGIVPVLLRGIGPGLTSFGVKGVVPDPLLNLFWETSVIASNDNWGSNGSSQVSLVAAQIGAFSLQYGSLDSCLYGSVSPASYTMQVSDVHGGTGVTLAEIYEIPSGYPGRLVNVSGRTRVGTGDACLVAGFVLSGTGRKTLLIRGIGPSLTGFGVEGALADPVLELVNTKTGEIVATNDNWQEGNATAGNFAKVGAFELAPGAKDAAIIVRVPAGNYTATVRGANGSTGIGLLEVYDME